VGYPFVAIPLCIKTFKTIGMTFREYLQALRPAIDGTVAMALLVGALKFGLADHVPLVVKLLTEILAGAGAYCATVYLFHKPRVMAFVRTAQNFRQARAERRRKNAEQNVAISS
jgi:hypothetical protein